MYFVYQLIYRQGQNEGQTRPRTLLKVATLTSLSSLELGPLCRVQSHRVSGGFPANVRLGPSLGICVNRLSPGRWGRWERGPNLDLVQGRRSTLESTEVGLLKTARVPPILICPPSHEDHRLSCCSELRAGCVRSVGQDEDPRPRGLSRESWGGKLEEEDQRSWGTLRESQRESLRGEDFHKGGCGERVEAGQREEETEALSWWKNLWIDCPTVVMQPPQNSLF